MKTAAKLSVLLVALFATACSDAPVTGPQLSEDVAIEAKGGHHRGASRVSVFSRNMYIGADVDSVMRTLANDPTNTIPVLLWAIGVLENTDFEARAGAMADEVARLRPDVIGLQEVYDITIMIPPLGVNIALDFQGTFEDSLAARGLNYVEAAKVTDTDAFLPAYGIHLVDHDVILVNPDRVDVHSGDGQLFGANLGDVGFGVEIVRGWTMIHATIAGMEMEVWNTHLESGSDPLIAGLRGAQAGELVSLASTEMPVVMMGDFNDEVGSPMHQVMTDLGGFEDVWLELRHRARGFTCCHEHDLSNRRARFDERIDYVFSRGIAHPRSGLQGQIRRTGLRPGERVPGPEYKIWPSDHAGLFAKFLMPPAHGVRP
jgi:hypothetical protein